MIDFTSVNHKRGIMILSSKDVRMIDKTLFEYSVMSICEQEYIDHVGRYIDQFEETGELDISMVKSYLKLIRTHNEHCREQINACRRVFS